MHVDQLIFLAIIQVSSLQLGGADVQHASISLLMENSMQVGFHILTLKSTAIHEADEDWIWRNCTMEEAGGKMKGRYVQPINPDIWQDDTMAHTTYIFMKTELQELTASLVVMVGIQGLNKLPKVECMPTYPYRRSTGKYSHF